MTPTFPTEVKRFVTKVNLVNPVNAEDINAIQDEITATQETLGAQTKTQFIGLFAVLSRYRGTGRITYTTGDTITLEATGMFIDNRFCSNSASLSRDLATDISASVSTTYYVYAVDDGDGTFSLKFRTSAADNFTGERKIGSVYTASSGSPPDIIFALDDDDGTPFEAPTAAYDSEVGLIMAQVSGTNKRVVIGYDIAIGASYIQSVDSGVGNKPLLLNANGGNVGVGTTIPRAEVDVAGSIRLNIKTAAADKIGHGIVAEQYDSAVETEGWQIIHARSDSATNILSLGGSASGRNAATKIRFLTAANVTTRTGTTRMFIDENGNVGVGTTPNAAAILDVNWNSVTPKGVAFPRMTTAERSDIALPFASLLIYNTTTNKYNFYNGSAWEAITSS